MKRGKSLAFLLSVVMFVSSMQPVLAEGEEGLENQVLNLTFDRNLTDSSPAGHQVEIGKGAPSYVEGVKGLALSFDGQSYVKLGMEEDLQPENLTVSFWLKPNGNMKGEQVITWSKAEYNSDGWYLTSENDSMPLALSIGPASSQPYKVSVTGMERVDFFPQNEWTHVAVTYEKASREVKFYRNGKICQTKIDYAVTGDATGILGADASMEKSLGYNGSVYQKTSLNAALDEYQLYNDVADVGEVIELYEESGKTFDKKEVAQADLNALSIPEQVTGNLNLVTQGASGSVITWSSDNEEVVSADGTVLRPGIGEDNVKVTLTAEASYDGGEMVRKTFEVVVLAKQEIIAVTDSIMQDVELEDDWLVNAASKENDYLLSLDSEKFLYEFYKLSGLNPKTDSGYEGWERSYGNNFRGHAFGHYMSALSQAYLCTDGETKAGMKTEIREAVDGLKECQDAYAKKYPSSAGYVSPFPEAWLTDKDGVPLANTQKVSGDTVYVPYYNLHKILAGLIDITRNVDDQEIKETALSVAESFGEYLYNRLGMLTDKDKMLRTEYGGMNEALYELYNLTGNDHFKTAAQYFDETELFKQLAANQDVLNGKHANTTIPKLTGALKRYTVLTENEEYYNALTPDEKDELGMYLQAAENFWQITVDHHTYVTGGNSQSEHFHEADKIGYDATKSEYDASTTCETCNTYNMLKLSKALYKVTGDKKYMDYFETTYINAILPSQNPETGTTMYFQPMAPGYNKVFNRPFDEFWCCTGTGMENFSKLGDNIYQVNADGASVHMFFSSELKDEEHHLKLKQTANIPNEDIVTFEVESADTGTVLRFRKPDWLAGKAEIKVNGSAIGLEEENGYYLVRDVKAGDKITYRMPMTIQAYTMPDKENLVAFKYGPVVLSAALGTNNIESSNPNGILVRVGTFDANCQTVITIENSSIEEWLADVADHVVRIEDGENGQIQFRLKNVDSESEALIYSPHYMRYQERYGIYMYMEEPDSEASQDRILANKEAIREEEMSTDYLNNFDDNNSEAAKGQAGENTAVGVWEGKGYRDAQKDGWFSYELRIDPDAEHNYLNCTFYSGDRGRKFDILINGEKAETYDFSDAPSENTFFVHRIELSKEQIAQAKEGKITVRFQSQPEYNSYVGGLFGISTSTSAAYDTDASLKAMVFDQGTLTEEFDPDRTEYVLEVSKDMESVKMLATPKMESGLVYVDNILIDDKHQRTIALTGDETIVTLNVKAQDHVTSKKYEITIRKTDAPVLDKTALLNKIEEAKQIRADGYTEESYAVLQEAIKQAEKAVGEVQTKEEVDAAVKALQEAIDGLEKEDSDAGKPDTGESGTGNSGIGTSDQGSEGEKTSSNVSVKTGDTTSVLIVVISMALAAGAMLGVVRRKTQKRK